MSKRILIIEDNATNLYLMEYLLKSSGCSVLTAIDGNTGLEVAERQPLDLIICDIQMPGMDGYDVVRRIRENTKLKDVQVVAITAFAMAGDRQKILASGFDNYLPKPIDPQKFAEQIERFLTEK